MLLNYFAEFRLAAVCRDRIHLECQGPTRDGPLLTLLLDLFGVVLFLLRIHLPLQVGQRSTLLFCGHQGCFSGNGILNPLYQGFGIDFHPLALEILSDLVTDTVVDPGFLISFVRLLLGYFVT